MDRIYKALIFDNEISLTVMDTTDMVNRAIEIHSLTPLAAAALGRTMTATAFMAASSLKNQEDHLSVTVKGDGPGGSIVVCANQQLQIRGYIDNPQVDLPLKPNGKLDVASCVGKGRISVVRNIGLKKPYTGSCHIISGEIAEDFAAYYTYSEQQPTGIALGVKIGKDLKCIAAGGVVLQPMPGAKEENIQKAEELLDNFGAVSSLLEELGFDGVIEKYFTGIEFNQYFPKYQCTCSRDYVDRILITLGEKELYETIEKEGKIEVVCHFCPEKYTYYKEDIDKLLGR